MQLPSTRRLLRAPRYLAGGTTLVDLMKLDVETPSQLIDINRLPLATIVETAEGGLQIGATVRNSDLAHDERIKRDYAVLSEALLAGASAQLRNKATTAGNLLQRTRCVYFRDPVMACNKREPGSGCSAIDGYNRNLAILGTSNHCIASNPSDMNVALMALDAVVHIQGQGGERDVPLDDFFVLPGDTPHIEHVLQPGELITHVTLPKPVAGARSLYLKLPGSGIVRICVGVDRHSGQHRPGRHQGHPDRHGRRRRHSVAAARSRRLPGRQARDAGQLHAGRRAGHGRRTPAKRERLQGRTGQTLPDQRTHYRDAACLNGASKDLP